MSEIVILHLSDIHFKKKIERGDNTFYTDVQEKLINAVKKYLNEHPGLDFVAITGDIAFSGKKNEYDKALVFLKDLKSVLPSGTEFLIVPGNHDVDRQKISRPFSLHDIVKNDKVDEFLERKKNIKDHVKVKFKSYRKFSEQLNPGLYESKEDYFWVKNYPDKDVSFLGLNSAWVSENEEDRLYITLGYPQVRAALKRSDSQNKVVLMHHPPFFLLEDEKQSRCGGELFKNCQLLLYGHKHSDDAVNLKNPSGSIIFLGVNASYTDDKDGFIGFQFIRVRFLNEGKAVKSVVWPYIFKKSRNDFVPDRDRWESQSEEAHFTIEAGETSTTIKEIQKTPSPPPLEIPVKYSNWVRHFCSRMSLEKLDPESKAFYVAFPEVYIPLETANPLLKTEDERAMKERAKKDICTGLGKETRHQEPPFIDIEKLAAREKCILLRGAAGMGKTTLLKHLAYTVTQGQGPALLNGHLPVVMFLKEIGAILQEEFSSKKTYPTFESLLQKYFKTALSGTLNLEEVQVFISNERAIFLLDGLDEIPGHLRRSLVELIAGFRVKHINSRFILTGRPHGIDAGVKEHFGEFLMDIEYLDKKKVKNFISKWLIAISGQGTGFAQVNADEMIADIRVHKHAEIFTRNPLLLTALCIFYMESGKRIPEQRAELYLRIMDNFLYRRFHDPSGPEKVYRIENYLKHLAFLMQEQNLKSFSVGEAKDLLKKHFPCKDEPESHCSRTIDNLFSEIEPRCGLLNRPYEGELNFLHATFQEFLAARFILDTGKDFKEYLKDDYWHETFLFYVSLISREQRDKANLIIKKLLDHSHKNTDWIRKLWLLGARSLGEIQSFKRDTDVIALACNKLTTIIKSGAPLDEHFEAGEILGILGDPRIKHTPMETVESGEFTRGGDKYKWEKPVSRIYLDEFMIGIYPVTNKEFEAFIQDGGYNNKDLWTPEGWAWKEKNNISEPLFLHDRKWDGPNFPVVGVSWFDAIAYSKWFSKKTGDLYTLPTEAQWEKAARGKDGFHFPWGKVFDKSLCNTYESKLKRTSPVGIFPKGKSPYGCFDMSGNVWEWCLDWYHEYYYKESPGKNPQGPLTGSFRIIRGGSWFNDAKRCPAEFRDYDEPQDRLNCVGFRLVKIVK